MSHVPGNPSDKDLTTAIVQVAGLTAAGLPLTSGLRAMAAESPTSGLRGTLQWISDRLERGESLETIFATLAEDCPGLLNLLQAGQKTGRMDLFLQDYLEHRREERRLQLRVLWTLIQSLLLLMAIGAIFTFWVAGFVNDFFEFFNRDYSQHIPVSDSMLMVLKGVMDYRLLIGILLVLSLVALVLACIPRFRSRALWWTGTVLPPVRDVMEYRATAGFTRLLADLVEQRISLPEALQIAGRASGSPALANSAEYLAGLAISGGDLGRHALFEKALFLDVSNAMRWHGDSRLFVPALRACGDFHNQQVTANWGFTVIERLLRPIVIIVIAVFVFWVYASMMMPLLRLLNNLS